MKANLTKQTKKQSQVFKKFMSNDDVTIAKQLLEDNTLTIEQIADKFAVHPATITNRIKAFDKLNANDDNPVKQKELTDCVNLLIILKKRLTTQLAQVNFDQFKSFDEITKALKTLTTIFSPLHAAYRSETAKSGQVQVNLTQIIEQSWENDDERRKKIVNMLQARKDAGKQAK